MTEKWTTASARKEFLRRERDILNKHRMARDIDTDLRELIAEQKARQGEMPLTGEEMAQ